METFNPDNFDIDNEHPTTISCLLNSGGYNRKKARGPQHPRAQIRKGCRSVQQPAPLHLGRPSFPTLTLVWAQSATILSCSVVS